MDLKLNANRFSGKEYVSLYNRYRPEPPKEILLQCLNYLGLSKANLILDLGCGTGISTRTLREHSNKIIGLEPSKEMLCIAREKTKEKNISYKQGYANEIEIESKSVDIVTCSQSFHWMEPKITLKEIDRVLKDDGVLSIYDVIWPPSVNYEYEQAYCQLFERVNKLTQELDEQIAYRWNKGKHLSNVKDSNFFNYVKESHYHKSERFDIEKFIGIAISQGGLEALLKKGFNEDEIGITKFRETVESAKKIINESLTYNYRVIFGVRRKLTGYNK